MKRAYETLIDEEERRRVLNIIKQARTRVLSERKRLKAKGATDESLGDLGEALKKESMKVLLACRPPARSPLRACVL